MSLFISDPSQATYSGVFAIQVAPPTIIEGVSLGFLGLVGAFDWGPVETIYTPVSTVDYLNTFAPPGSPRQSTGYRATIGRPGLSLKVVRVIGASYAVAVTQEAGTGGNVNATAKYAGTLGNSIVVTQAAAASGVTTHRDYTVALTDPITGTTSESYPDVPLPTGAGNVVVNVANSLLLGSFTLDSAMTAFPANGSWNLGVTTAGSNGSALTTTEYTGTQGATDQGCALFEADSQVSVVAHDDCGDSHRTAINDAFVAHAEYMGDRIACVDASPNDANWAAVVAEVTGAVVDKLCVFSGAWAQVFDDGGVLVTTPLSTFVGNVFCNVPAFQSHAWRADTITQYYSAIQGVVANFSVIAPVVRSQAFALGINLPIQLNSGKWAMQHDRNTNTSVGARYTVTQRINQFLAKSLVAGSDSFVNGPNVVDQQRSLKIAVDNFLDEYGRRGYLATDDSGKPLFSTDYKSQNTPTTIGQGEFFLAINGTSPSPMERIFLLLNVNPFVQVVSQ